QAPDQLLGLGKRSVHDRAFALGRLDARHLAARLQALGSDEHAGLVHVLVESHVRAEQFLVEWRVRVGWRAVLAGLRGDDESHGAGSSCATVLLSTTNEEWPDRHPAPSGAYRAGSGTKSTVRARRHLTAIDHGVDRDGPVDVRKQLCSTLEILVAQIGRA